MPAAPPRPDEARAIAALHELDVLDTGPEPVFDALVKAASIAVGTPISLITLVDTRRQWFKASVGLSGVTETPRDVAFCAYAVLQDELLEVPDATQDPRFADNPYVTNDPAIRFYAGAPLKLRDGERVGTLCVVDREPRRLDAQQREILSALALAATHALESRRAVRALREAALETARSETQLAYERRRLATAIEGAHVGLWDLNLRTGEVKVSSRLAEMVGESVESLGTITLDAWGERVHPDDVKRVRAMFMAHVRGETPRYTAELRVRHRDGHWLYVVDNGRVMTRARDGSVEWVIGSRIDMSARKAQEEALRRSERFLDRTGRLAGVGGWLVELESGRVHWSEETYRIHGVALDYVPTLESALEFYPPSSRAILSAAVEIAIADGRGWDLELPFRRADGAVIWVRTVGTAEREGDKVVQLVGAFQDVTSRVLENQALRSANERIEIATDAGQIGIWELDLATQRVNWDARMYRIYGLPPGAREVGPEQWSKYARPASAAVLASAFDDAIADRKPFDVEFDITWPDGSVRHVRSSARVVRDAESKATRFIGAMWDVTEPRRVAAELRRQSRLSTVQAGIANVANHTSTLREAMRITVDLVCAEMGWPLGHVYERSTAEYDLLVPTDVWNIGSVAYPLFRAETAKTTFQLGVGIVGSALRNRRATVLRDLTQPPCFRVRSAAEYELAWGLSAPVFVGEEIVAVLEFFGRGEFEQWFLDVVAYAGLQLGRVVDRERANRKLEQRTEALREKSRGDELTGLYNRRGFLELAEERRATAARAGQRVYLLFADLDGMKRINDELGHDMGDLAIRELSNVLRRTLRTTDLIARLGGDEFVALTLETGSFDAGALLGRLEAKVVQVNAEAQLPFTLSASFGVAGPADPADALTDVLKRADEEMYRAKVARKKARPPGR